MQLLISHAFGQQLSTTDRTPNEFALPLSEHFDVVSVFGTTADRFLPHSSSPGPGFESDERAYVQAWDQARRATRPRGYKVASQVSRSKPAFHANFHICIYPKYLHIIQTVISSVYLQPQTQCQHFLQSA
jgi:hypothetical protein